MSPIKILLPFKPRLVTGAAGLVIGLEEQPRTKTPRNADRNSVNNKESVGFDK